MNYLRICARIENWPIGTFHLKQVKETLNEGTPFKKRDAALRRLYNYLGWIG